MQRPFHKLWARYLRVRGFTRDMGRGSGRQASCNAAKFLTVSQIPNKGISEQSWKSRLNESSALNKCGGLFFVLKHLIKLLSGQPETRPPAPNAKALLIFFVLSAIATTHSPFQTPCGPPLYRYASESLRRILPAVSPSTVKSAHPARTQKTPGIFRGFSNDGTVSLSF